MIVLGTLGAVALIAGIFAIAAAFPGRDLGYVTVPLALLVFALGMQPLLKAAEPKAELARSPDLTSAEESVWDETLAVLRTRVEPGRWTVFASSLSTTSTKERRPAWQQVMALLAAPILGLVFVSLLSVAMGYRENLELLRTLAGLVLFMNAASLLPFQPFAGGQVATLLLFADYPRAQAVLDGLGSLLFVFLAVWTRFWPWGLLAGLVLLPLSLRHRMAICAARLRGRLGADDAPPRAADASDEVLRGIVLDWRASSARGLKHQKPRGLAGIIAQIYALALVPRAGLGARVGLGLVYLALLLPSAYVLTSSLRH